MNSTLIRKTFLDFFSSKQHQIVPSAPMVIKDDPSLMFTNAGMNQFKDIFLGNSPIKYSRIADTQKCLRVSGKHNDLEEVGHDTYHHTMFEMLGNWSFGDYFKEEAIAWGWELLTEVYKIDKTRLYITIFGGDKGDNLSEDSEALEIWKKIVPEERIIRGSKKDNFWEMGESGPCGPCSEIHIDIRDDADRKRVDGKTLVNTDNPLVIEIWNLVFIQFNRLASGQLVPLPAKHVDTGMGFERLCMVLQGVKSNYDTDVFQPLIQRISSISGVPYGKDAKSDIAMRVIADHLRAISFAIADGQLPSNNKAGYVIRRILRRAVRYGYTFLGVREPFLAKVLSVLVEQMGAQFTELKSQEMLVGKVLTEEEQTFLRTLAHGIQKFSAYLEQNNGKTIIDGGFAFELYDTYGFPIDLTQLMAREQGWEVDMIGFNEGLEKQKARSRQDAVVEAEDWVSLIDTTETRFVGYDVTEAEVKIVRYRKVSTKGKTFYYLVFDQTPFYAESGGQVGDNGIITSKDETITIIDTKKENNLPIHITEQLPSNISTSFKATVLAEKRTLTSNNHSATHLLHQALRSILGTHVEQKGSYVNEEYLRFDFSHFQKLSEEDITQVERMVNSLIRKNIPLNEHRGVPIDEAKSLGALALFGEKYGDAVRVIRFGESVELCGGTHVPATGQIGLFKLVSESAIAAGIRRIEAVTATRAEDYIIEHETLLKEIKGALKSSLDPVKSIQQLIDQNKELQKEIDEMKAEKADLICKELINKIKLIGTINFIAIEVDLDTTTIKDLAFKLRTAVDNLYGVIANRSNGKANLSVVLSDNLVSEKKLNAGNIVRELAKEIQGGGGGQPTFATAGGKNPEGIAVALAKAIQFIQ
ncbi:MAG: alanine--tRNA ligase [Bacteroidetes bacterium]|nr:alanine--tRNA ligase [Bacteroidota bacterium]